MLYLRSLRSRRRIYLTLLFISLTFPLDAPPDLLLPLGVLATADRRITD